MSQSWPAAGLSLWCVALLLLAGSLALEPLSWAASSATPSAEVQDLADGFTAYRLRAGTPLFVVMLTPVNTATNQLNDPVEAIATQDLYLGNQRILTKNTRLRGLITVLEPPIEGRNAILAIRFTELLLSNGEVMAIQAYVRTERPDHTWGGELTDGTKPMNVTYRIEGIGEYNRLMFGGPRAMGAHLAMGVGERLTLILEQPVTLVLPTPE